MTRGPRIAFFADTLHAPVGGGITSGHHFVERLRRSHEVVVVGTDPHDNEAAVKMPGFVLPVKSMRESHFVMARPQSDAIARAVAAADVVHLQFPFWLSFAALAEAQRQHKPVVAAFHVQPENLLYNVGVRSQALARTIYRAWVKHLYAKANAVICPSAFAEKKLRAHGLVAPTWILTNGVPDDATPGPSRREPEHEGQFLVVMVGRLAAEKRQDILFEAVRRSRHADRIRVVVAGMGPRAGELVTLSRDMPHPPQIGFLPRARLIELLRSADLFVHASEVELEGIAVLEAMRIGLPALVADAPESAAAHLVDDDAFRFPAGDPAALAARIDALVESPALLAAGRRASLEKARSFDIDASVESLAAIYRTVHEERHRARRASA